MNEFVRLAEESVGAYLVGKRIMEKGTDLAVKKAEHTVSALISSVISLLIVSISIFMMLIGTIVWIGYTAAVYYHMPALMFLIPIVFLAIITFILWVAREKLFQKLTSSFINFTDS